MQDSEGKKRLFPALESMQKADRMKHKGINFKRFLENEEMSVFAIVRHENIMNK
jgi:hypothetical protein